MSITSLKDLLAGRIADHKGESREFVDPFLSSFMISRANKLAGFYYDRSLFHERIKASE